jgi:hypothetical protein
MVYGLFRANLKNREIGIEGKTRFFGLCEPNILSETFRRPLYRGGKKKKLQKVKNSSLTSKNI